MKTVKSHILGKSLLLEQPENGFRVSLDSVLVAAACIAKPNESVLDMGCGIGGAAFCLLKRVPDITLTGIDIQSSYIDLARKNALENGFDAQTEFMHDDVLKYKVSTPAGRFDHIICNPPYMNGGTHLQSPHDDLALARGHVDHKNPATVQDWIKSALRLLKSGGSLTIIHRADHVDKIILALGKSFGAADIIPLWPKDGVDAKRVIVRAIKDRKTPARLSHGLVLHQDNGDYTAKADDILKRGKALL